jgi:hypothetical protein
MEALASLRGGVREPICAALAAERAPTCSRQHCGAI